MDCSDHPRCEGRQTMIVVDANVIVALVREGSLTPVARAIYIVDADWIVRRYGSRRSSMRSSMRLRFGNVTLAGALEATDMAATVLRNRVRDCRPADILATAHRLGLTAYDATYVVLARSPRHPSCHRGQANSPRLSRHHLLHAPVSGAAGETTRRTGETGNLQDAPPWKTRRRMNLANAHKLLQQFDFTRLLVEELGWSNPSSGKSVSMSAKGIAFSRREVAEL